MSNLCLPLAEKALNSNDVMLCMGFIGLNCFLISKDNIVEMLGYQLQLIIKQELTVYCVHLAINCRTTAITGLVQTVGFD